MHFSLTRPAEQHSALQAVYLRLSLAPVALLQPSFLQLSHNVQYLGVLGVGFLARRNRLAAKAQLLLVQPITAFKADHGLAATGQGTAQGTTAKFALQHYNYRLSKGGGLEGM